MAALGRGEGCDVVTVYIICCNKWVSMGALVLDENIIWSHMQLPHPGVCLNGGTSAAAA